jgi:hypothetical protein
MTVNQGSDCGLDAPSVKECIAALYDHNDLFDTMAEYPQAGIYETFAKESALAIAYVESKVHQCGRAVEVFLRENARSGRNLDDGALSSQYTTVMNELIEMLLLHGM